MTKSPSMEVLRRYLKKLSVSEQEEFAVRCGTSIGYLRKAMSLEQRIGDVIVIALERESGGEVRCEDLRPDVDWAYLRGTAPTENGDSVPRSDAA